MVEKAVEVASFSHYLRGFVQLLFGISSMKNEKMVGKLQERCYREAYGWSSRIEFSRTTNSSSTFLSKLVSRECACWISATQKMDVSINGGIPKSSILMGFSIINHPFWGTPIFGNTHMLFLFDWAYIWSGLPPCGTQLTSWNIHIWILWIMRITFFPKTKCDQIRRCSSTKDLYYNEGEANLVLHPRKPIAGSWNPKNWWFGSMFLPFQVGGIFRWTSCYPTWN